MDLILKHEVDRILAGQDGANLALANDLLVDYLEERKFVRSAALSRSMRMTPRHLFMPDANPQIVYQDRALTTARNGDGWFDSSCSTPSIVSVMTEALEIKNGDRILELGTGTGWTAALMANLASDLKITTLEVLPELADSSRARLAALGFDQIEVRCADGSAGSAGPGPYDKIIFACGAQSMPWHLVDLLVDGGRLVIPVGDFLYSFTKHGRKLRGGPLQVATFIAFQEGEPLRSWLPFGDRAVLAPQSLRDVAAALASDDLLPIGTMDLDAGQIETLLFWISFAEPDRHYLIAGREHGWGFGLVDPDAESAAAVYCDSDFTFRHYRAHNEEAQVAVFGGESAGQRLLEICEEVAALGWPRLEDLSCEVGTVAQPKARLQRQVADEVWSISLAPVTAES